MEEEVKKRKPKKSGMAELPSMMAVLLSHTIRGIVNEANAEGIQREDVISLLKENGQYVLIYYKYKE